jgi:hypothetical protein
MTKIRGPVEQDPVFFRQDFKGLDWKKSFSENL